MHSGLFVYGTLMFAEIRQALLGKTLRAVNVFLYDYERYTIMNGANESEYPVLKKNPGTRIEGILLESLNKTDMELLSFYEGEEYILKKIIIKTNNDKDKQTTTFFPVDMNSILYGKKWEEKFFIENHLKKYTDIIIPGILNEFNSR